MKPPPPGRFLALDGLRGIAALAVLVFHMFWNSASADVLQAWLPGAVTSTTGFLRSGVAIFFVISGFVIAHTTASMRTLSEGGRFALRRQVRLDPPYYMVLALVLVIEFGQSLVPGLVPRTFTPLDVLVNMLYLQDILGVPSILAVAWTLCLEVQFYLVVVILAITAARLAGSDLVRRHVVVWSATALGLVSLALPFVGISGGPWVIGVWWMFAVGMMLAWYAEGTVRLRFVASAFAVLVAWALLLQLVVGRADPWGGEWFAIATGLFIAVVVARGSLARSPGRLLLYFGRISYPLYLVHLPVIAVLAGAGFKFFGDQPVTQLLIIAFAGVASIGVAELLHRWVEVPAIGWSRQLKRRRGARSVSDAQPASPPPEVA
jgi:peptidoglycan/LPS O-acetylase OafA/YrhL